MRNGYEILVANLKEETTSEDLDIDGRMLSEYILDKYGGKIAHWIHLAQDRDKWRTLVNMVMCLLGYIKGGKFLDS
jgi:hypothetical protein